MSLPNRWHLRRVADTAARACYICYKPSSSVLITPDNKDFFYICPSHLKDRHFCSPIIDSAEEARKKREEVLAREIEAVKKEYEEKQTKKRAAESKDTSEGEPDSKKKKDQGNGEEKDEDEKIDFMKMTGAATPPAKADDDSPRIFALHKNFYQMRIDRLRNIEVSRRNRERMKDPTFFPAAPSGF